MPHGEQSQAVSIKAGVDTKPASVMPSGMLQTPHCAECPLVKAEAVRQAGGTEAEAHFLRVQAVELVHKLALTRSALRSLGVDPDVAYHPHEQDRG